MYKKTFLKLGVLFLTLLSCAELEAQQRFRAAVVGGFNISQIRGDFTGGYNKFGLVGGLRVNTILTEKMDLGLELVYSHRGSKSDNVEQAQGFDVQVNLDYVEVPVLFNYKDWYVEGEDYYKVQATAGFAYSRLISGESVGTTNLRADIAERFIEDDFSFVIGAEMFFFKQLSLSARWHTSINLLYNPERASADDMALRPHYLSFRLNYFFN